MTVAILLIVGFINARNPQIKKLNIYINKASKLQDLKIIAVSDIHIGSIVNRNRVLELVNKINTFNPDLVLLPGDILDEDLTPVLKFNMGEPLKKIKSKYGVYAITGNHEFIGGIKNAVDYINSLNIKLLRDSTALIENEIYIIGRDDRAGKNFRGLNRKSLNQLMQNIDTAKPLILLDHQPFNLNEAMENNIDLQISGHTHHGQLWPINYITEKVYELSWGYKKKANTHYYVSCGYGTWGPPIRIGNTPEIVLFEISFKK